MQRAYLDAETKVVRLPLLEGPAPARLVINDTHFLFTADFKKSGPDLILTGDDGKKLVIANYFNFEKHPDLVSPDGAVISAELVERLAGPEAPGQYAQAGAPAGAVVIGRVEIVSVNATVQHANGVVDNLKNGDSLLKGDVVMTGDGEGCTLSLIDGTALNMGSNGRMVLAELTYDSQSTSNSALINLVKGSFVFVAGQVAHTGDMRVSTPVATMGIRGTTVGTYLDADVNGNVYELTATLLTDPGGSSGAYDLLDPVTGAVLHRVRSTATQVTLSYGANNQLSMQEASKSPAILQHEIAVAQILFPIFLANPNNVQVNQPATPQPPNNSLTPPQLLPQPPQETDANNFLHIITTAAKITQPSVDNATSATANFLVIAPPTEVLNNTALTLAVVSLIETDTAAFDHFTAATGAVLSTNPSPNAALTFGISGGAAGSSVLLGGITYDVSNTGAYGTLYVNSSTGAYVFVPNDAAINALTAITTETFIITVSDGTASAQQPLTVTLNGHNDTPTSVAGSTAASGSFSESAGVTGSVATEGASGSIAFADVDLGQVHTVSASAPTFAWSGGTLTAAQLAVLTAAAALTLTVTDSTSSSPGSVEWTYSIADKALDFLAKGETLTLTYMATVDDHNGGTVTQPITITITGTDDAPVITAATSNAFAELPGTNIATPDTVGGTISFTDVDLSDRPTVTAPFASYSYLAAGGTALTLTAAQQTALEATLAIVPTAGSTNNGSASWTYSVADKALDFLAKGETLTLTYMATVDDHNGGTVTQPITITITGTDDAPVITAATSNAFAELPGTNIATPDTVGGTISFTDVDLSDRPTVTAPFASYSYLAAGGTALTLTAAQQTALEATLAIVPTAGSTNNGSASWTYSVADKALDFLAKGETLTLTYMATVDDHNGGIVTQPITITITGADDAPVITSGPAAVVVSEEGLPNGVPDTLPAILDTTNSPTASGTITGSDADGDPLTMTLGAPSVPLTSDGVTIEWTLQDAGHTLIGKAGTTPIITATITNAGAYTVTLTGPIDHPVAGQEDDKTFTVPVAVSDGLITTPTTLSVTVEDDSPKAEPIEVSVVPTDSKTNVMLMLDLSGSMNNSSGLPGLTRLDVEKAAINELLDQYDNRGDVMVRIVEFSNSGAAIGNAWMSVADAKAAVAGLSASGNTNYDAALLTAMAAFADGTKLSGPSTQNVSYFLSDGDPTANSDWPQIPGAQLANGIQANEQAVWESFLTTNNMVSFALGIPNVATPSNLNPIAFDPAAGTQLADTPIIVTNLGQLANTLVFTLPPVTGSILAGAGGTTSNSFGADGGFVQSITVEGVTYTFNPAANGGAGGITTSGGGSFTYDATTKTLAVDTDTNVVGGELAMVMTTGAFTFQPPTGFSGETVGYVLVDHDGDTASSVINFSGTTLTPGQILPAGVAGDPINLGLPDTADHVGPVTMTIAGVPSGWTLSEGADNGDGTWTIQASNVSALAITSPDDQAGAMAFTVTMSWTNADSSSGFVRITDNVEVFAQGAPMFAFSGDDNLTGSIGRDLFVFAQPIGNDRIYNFNPSEDHVDLIGFPGFASFDSVKDHLTTDANGNAVIALADGQSILLDGVAAASLGASNFVFNQEPVTNNADTVTIGDGAALPLSGVVDNTGTIALDSTGNETQLKLIQNGITLQGGGRVILSDNGENVISGTIPNVTLINADNTISGAGQLGDGQMTLVNGGTIAATGTHALIIDTGPNVVLNSGTLEATGSGSLIINSDVANSGLIWANGGNITINGAVIGSGTALVSGAATLEFGSGSSADISFAADAVGTLILQDPADFAGTISGFFSHDQIDLMNISNSMASIYSITYSLSSDVTTLIITDGTNSDTINFIGNYTVNTAWHFSNDGHGGTLITDQPEDSGTATVNSSTTLEIVGAAEQNLSFANDHGNSGTLVLDHSASFTGQIGGFAGDGTLSNSDSIDLKDVDFAAAKETYSGGILTVTDDAHTANLHFDGDYVLGNFVLASDDHGGTLVIDPPAPLDLTARFEPDHPDTGVQEAHGLAQEQTFSGFPLATANVTLDQFHFGNMDLTGLNAHAGDLTPAISSFGSDHFQFAAMDTDGFHQTPIVQPLELDLHHTPLQEIVEAGAPGVHNVTPMASEVSPGASLLDVIHAIHAHTA